MVYTLAKLAKRSGFSESFWLKEIKEGRLGARGECERKAYAVSDQDLERWRSGKPPLCAYERDRDAKETAERQMALPDRKNVGACDAHQDRGLRGRKTEKADAVRARFKASLPGDDRRKRRTVRRLDKAG